MLEQPVKFRKSEVIAYLEEKIISDIATPEESELYEDYHWYGKLNKNKTLKKVIREMRDIYENGY